MPRKTHKLMTSIRGAYLMFMARMRGEYKHTVGGYDQGLFNSYHVYVYRNKVWHFPDINSNLH